jgi:hypothetical protein
LSALKTDVGTLPSFDFLFCALVLQHNPPPLAAWILQTLLERLSPGGYLLIQLATYIEGYRFDLEQYLSESGGGMEGHAVPQGTVFEIFGRAGVAPMEVCEDGFIGLSEYRSNTFFARKRA